MFFENISWCMQVQNSKQGFDNISHLHWHVNQTSLKHLHPQPNALTRQKKQLLNDSGWKIQHKLTWTFRRWEETLLFLNWTTKLSIARVFTFNGQYNLSQFNPPKVLIPPVNHEYYSQHCLCTLFTEKWELSKNSKIARRSRRKKKMKNKSQNIFRTSGGPMYADCYPE